MNAMGFRPLKDKGNCIDMCSSTETVMLLAYNAQWGKLNSGITFSLESCLIRKFVPEQQSVRNKTFCCSDTPMYIPFITTAGQSVELLCNTSFSADIMWTYDTGDPYVQYVLWNSRIDSDKSHRVSVKTTGGNFHNLFISDVHLSDSGLYNCYAKNGSRKVGYQLIVTGMWSVILCIINLTFS